MNLPSLKPTVPFGTKLKPPFFIVQPPATVIEDIKNLADAIDEFVRIGMPAIGEKMCYVADYRGVMACGYYTLDDADEPTWFGVEEGFRLLEQHPLADMLEVASAEIMARRACEHQ